MSKKVAFPSFLWEKSRNMASGSSIKCIFKNKLGTFPCFAIYVVLEWTMIVLLFVDGLLAFVSNEIARIFDLRIPCLLCTRIDHVLVRRNPNFYYNESICESHKKDISSRAYCHVHRRLSDIKTMCDGCLLSFATPKDSSSDAHKSISGILHKDIDSFHVDSDQRPEKKEEHHLSVHNGGGNRCSCCGDPLKARTSAKKHVRSSSIGSSFGYGQGPFSFPRANCMSGRQDDRNLEHPFLQYSELKLIPENEPVVHGAADGLNPENRHSEYLPEETCKTPSFVKGNRFFGIPLTDSAQASPRWSTVLAKKLQVEKAGLASDSSNNNDSILSQEGEGESTWSQMLKPQVRPDRKSSLVGLYMELDEERSAAAVGANNAMAMITRLQTEKAAVQMEALQYQRMMEEQAEYDQEAIQAMKEMLCKSEEDVRILEAEVETYREKYGEIKRVGDEICQVDAAADDYQEFSTQYSPSFSGNSNCISPVREIEGSTGVLTFYFEKEKSHLFGLLGNLEKKIDLPSSPNEDRGEENRATLIREMSVVRERLRAMEAESGFLKQAAMALQKGDEGTKLLAEIAQHLHKLRNSSSLQHDDPNA